MYVTPSYPGEVWDGSSRNPDRTARADYLEPNADDWDRVVAEVIATQEKVHSLEAEGVDVHGLVWKGAWSNSTAYAVNDAVSSGGSTYICVQAHTGQQPPNATYWNVLAAKGDTGSQGVAGAKGDKGDQGDPGVKGDPGMTWKGAWVDTTAYLAGDAVEHNGSSYIAVDANTGPEPPSAHWNLVAAEGAQGDAGAKGDKGDPGNNANVPDPSGLDDGDYVLHVASGVATWVPKS